MEGEEGGFHTDCFALSNNQRRETDRVGINPNINPPITDHRFDGVDVTGTSAPCHFRTINTETLISATGCTKWQRKRAGGQFYILSAQQHKTD